MSKAHLLNFYLFIALSFGIILSRIFSGNSFSLIFLLISLPVYFLFRRKVNLIADVFLLLVFVLAGYFLGFAAGLVSPDLFVERQAKITFKVASLATEKNQARHFLGRVETVNGIKTNFKIHLSDYTHQLEYLNRYQAEGIIKRRNFSSRNYYSLILTKKTKLFQMPLGFVERVIKKLENSVRQILKNNLSPSAYCFAAAVFLGRRELLGPGQLLLQNVGLGHLLALSGLHVAIFSAAVFFILGLFYLKQKLKIIILLIILVLYGAITGVSVSVLRAIIFVFVLALGFFLNRKVNPLNCLGLAGLIVLMIDPLWLFEVSFILSFTCVFALIFSANIVPLKFSRNAISYLIGIFVSSFWIVLMLSPLSVYFFKKIYWLSIIYNLIVIPFFAFILVMVFGLIVFSPFKLFAVNLAVVIELAIKGFIQLSSYLARLPFAVFVCEINLFQMLLCYLWLAQIIYVWQNRKIIREQLLIFYRNFIWRVKNSVKR